MFLAERLIAESNFQQLKSGRSSQENETKKVTTEGSKRKPGRLKGSRNKNKAEVVLNPELMRIQKMIQSLLNTIQGRIRLAYLLLDGHFGNYPAFQMVRQCQLHLISKLRYDANLHLPYDGPAPKHGPRRMLGEKVDVCKIDDKLVSQLFKKWPL